MAETPALEPGRLRIRRWIGPNAFADLGPTPLAYGNRARVAPYLGAAAQTVVDDVGAPARDDTNANRPTGTPDALESGTWDGHRDGSAPGYQQHSVAGRAAFEHV